MGDIIAPSLDEKIRVMKILDACDLESTGEEVLLEHLSFLMKGYMASMTQIEAGLLLYRGIKYERKPMYKSDLVYPPLNLAKRNRANKEGIQMFYCSTIKKAPFYELSIEIGDKMAIATWVLNKLILPANIGYAQPNLKSLGTLRENPYPPPLTEDIRQKNENDFVANFLSSAFCKKVGVGEDFYYKLTNAIATKFGFSNVFTKNYSKIPFDQISTESSKPVTVYNEAQKFPGIIYPTIQNSGEAENFAFLKEAIDDDLLEIERIEFIEILGIENNKYQYKLIDIALGISNNVIEWLSPENTWVLTDEDEDIVFVKTDKIDAYDKMGNIITPL